MIGGRGRSREENAVGHPSMMGTSREERVQGTLISFGRGCLGQMTAAYCFLSSPMVQIFCQQQLLHNKFEQPCFEEREDGNSSHASTDKDLSLPSRVSRGGGRGRPRFDGPAGMLWGRTEGKAQAMPPVSYFHRRCCEWTCSFFILLPVIFRRGGQLLNEFDAFTP